MPNYLVETVSMFRIRYLVEAAEPHDAEQVVLREEAKEFGQHYVGEKVVNVREVTEDEIPKLFFEDHPYLESWGPEKAFEYITKFES